MIDFINVSKVYKTSLGKSSESGHALSNVNFRIDDGEFVFIVGHSGAGKSTIIKLITRETSPTEGEIFVNNFYLNDMRKRSIPKLRRSMGIVFQDYRLIDTISVEKNIEFALRVIDAHRGVMKHRVEYVLDLVGLSDKKKAMPTELSGGEQQRVAIARALVNNPKLIIADEPTGNLDSARGTEILDMLEAINALGTTVLVVTHNTEYLPKYKKRVITLKDGQVLSDVHVK